jgi:hypothetical protein
MCRKFWTLLLALLLAPCAALAADETETGMATLWESLWHQSGTPTRVVRWENEIRMKLSGIDLAQHRDYITKAIRTVTDEAGVRLVDVSDLPNADQLANFKLEVVPDTALEDNQPCVTYLDFKTEDKIDFGTMQMRSKDVWRCSYHEAMHLMGVRGHPSGKTVLSYFPSKVDGLLPLDRVMLRAWYSPKMRGGMTPLEAFQVLGDELVATMPDRTAAAQSRDRFNAQVIEQMQSFAAGRGDVPTIVKRSGKSTEEGIRRGRSEMSYFLGVAYFEGALVAADQKQALSWFERAASAGNRGAQSRLAGPGK